VTPKPACLGEQSSAAFGDASVAHAYQYRPPYPAETFSVLADLSRDIPRPVLDVGCGTGAIARHLIALVDRIDAVDVSPAMIDEGKRLPQGDHPRLSWIVGRAEDAPLRPPYSLITAGDSLHWMDWYTVMPRFARLLTPNGYLAILGVGQLPTLWDADLRHIIRRYSTIRNFQPYEPVADVEERGLFQRAGTWRTQPVSFTQSIAAYVESFHGRASFSRDRMPMAEAAAFDAEVTALVSSFSHDPIDIHIVTEITWGKPLNPHVNGS